MLGDNTTKPPSADVADQIAEGYSLTVFVFVQNESTNIERCPLVTFIAMADYCREDPTTKRPTHGILFWCQPPSTLTDTERGHLMLHELMHVVTAVNLIGIDAPGSGCVRNLSVDYSKNSYEYDFPDSCKN